MSTPVSKVSKSSAPPEIKRSAPETATTPSAPHPPAGAASIPGPATRWRPRVSGVGAPARGQAGPEVRLQLRMVRLSDAVVVVAVLLMVFVVTNIGRMPDGFAEFLALRVTVKNLVAPGALHRRVAGPGPSHRDL